VCLVILYIVNSVVVYGRDRERERKGGGGKIYKITDEDPPPFSARHEASAIECRRASLTSSWKIPAQD